jgi:hypothetical protein
MNDRIKELLHESFDNCDGSSTERIYSLKQSEIEKFAELIANDCIEMFSSYGLNGSEMPIADIRSLFGISE